MDLSFNEMERILSGLTQQGLEPEVSLYINEQEYMVIVYEDHCSFQRCGAMDGSGEKEFPSLQDLYHAETVDHIVLERDWNEITGWYCFEMEYYQQET